MRLLLSSLRSRLIFLVLLPIIPLVALLVYSVLEHRRTALAKAEGDTLNLAREISENHTDIIEGARQLLMGLVQLPQVHDYDSPFCNALFSRLHQQFPLYTIMGAAKPNGDLFCSSPASKKPVNLSDRPYFQEILKNRALVLNGYQIGRVTGKASIPIAYPSLDKSGNVRAVVFVGIEIGWINRIVAGRSLPQGSVVSLIDPGGLILYRHPQPEKWVGKTVTEPIKLETLMVPKEGGVTEMTGLDGAARLYAFSRIRNLPESRAPIVMVGVLKATVFAEVNRIARRDIIVVGLILLLALIAAGLTAERSVIRPAHALMKAADRLATGDLGVRTGLPHNGGELGQLARSFDSMAKALQTAADERKKAEETLRLQNTALESAANSIVITDCEGCIVWVNPAFSRLTGYNWEEARGQNPRILKSGKQDQSYYQNLWETILSGQAWHGELINRRKDGSLYIEEQTITPVRDEHGRTSHFIAIKQDITGRKQAEEEVRHQLHRITALREIDRAITSTLNLGTVLDILLEQIDCDLPYSATTIRLFNKENGLLEPVACRNLDEQEWKTEKWKPGRGLANAVFEAKVPVVILDAQTDPRVRDPEFYRKHRLVSYLGIPLIAKGENLGVLSFYTKERHEFDNNEIEFLTTMASQAAIAIHNSQLYEQTEKLAADLKEEAEKLGKANRVKDEFLSVMSHELRTPLNVVVGYSGMILDGVLGEINQQQKEALQKVISRANDQLALVNNILYATTLEVEKIKIESHEIDLKDFLHNLNSGYDIPTSRELIIKFEHPSELPVIRTDSQKLKQILQNLIDNAVKFTEKGTVTISARYIPEAKAVQFKVVDTGIGISEGHLPLIFDKFRQVDSSETRLHGGVGMGLYIVGKFTELLGGTVEVESELGRGSVFTVTIPLQPSIAESKT